MQGLHHLPIVKKQESVGSGRPLEGLCVSRDKQPAFPGCEEWPGGFVRCRTAECRPGIGEVSDLTVFKRWEKENHTEAEVHPSHSR